MDTCTCRVLASRDSDEGSPARGDGGKQVSRLAPLFLDNDERNVGHKLPNPPQTGGVDHCLIQRPTAIYHTVYLPRRRPILPARPLSHTQAPLSPGAVGPSSSRTPRYNTSGSSSGRRTPEVRISQITLGSSFLAPGTASTGNSSLSGSQSSSQSSQSPSTSPATERRPPGPRSPSPLTVTRHPPPRSSSTHVGAMPLGVPGTNQTHRKVQSQAVNSNNNSSFFPDSPPIGPPPAPPSGHHLNMVLLPELEELGNNSSSNIPPCHRTQVYHASPSLVDLKRKHVKFIVAPESNSFTFQTSTIDVGNRASGYEVLDKALRKVERNRSGDSAQDDFPNAMFTVEGGLVIDG